MSQHISRLLKENKTFIVFIALMCIFRSAVADWNSVPTGSMKPTIVEGDRILVNKLAYDVRIPFTMTSLYKIADPERGDIIVFESEVSQKRLVKRVIGIPGDVVELVDNVLMINGVESSYQHLVDTVDGGIFVESAVSGNHKVTLSERGSSLSTFAPVVVPAGAYLAMGDNRDHSADSRVIGFVPRSEIIGRSKMVVMSLNYDNHYLPRSDRFLQSL